MGIEPELLRKILVHLEEHPAPQRSSVWRELSQSVGDDEKLVMHMLYLEEHGLIKSGITRGANGDVMINSSVTRLTARGRDHLSADGGLSAKLNTVTVKIHEESLARLEDFLSRNTPDQSVAAKMSARLRELPSAAIGHLTMKILDWAMEKFPAEVLRIVRNAIGL
jgi:hypothetical protein